MKSLWNSHGTRQTSPELVSQLFGPDQERYMHETVECHHREYIRTLLDNEHPWPTWGAVDQSREHLGRCEGCALAFPNGNPRLASLRFKLEQDTISSIREARGRYGVALAQAKLVDTTEGYRDAFAHLAAAGSYLSEALWSVNTSGVPWGGFNPIIESTRDEEIEAAWIGAWEFFSRAQELRAGIRDCRCRSLSNVRGAGPGHGCSIEQQLTMYSGLKQQSRYSSWHSKSFTGLPPTPKSLRTRHSGHSCQLRKSGRSCAEDACRNR